MELLSVPRDKLLDLIRKHNGQLIGNSVTFPNDEDWQSFRKEILVWHAFYQEARQPDEPLN